MHYEYAILWFLSDRIHYYLDCHRFHQIFKDDSDDLVYVTSYLRCSGTFVSIPPPHLDGLPRAWRCTVFWWSHGGVRWWLVGRWSSYIRPLSVITGLFRTSYCPLNSGVHTVFRGHSAFNGTNIIRPLPKAFGRGHFATLSRKCIACYHPWSPTFFEWLLYQVCTVSSQPP